MSAGTGNLIAIPGYEVIRELGAGGQARVYLAEQQSFQRKVAIKVLLPSAAEDPAFTARFLREARIVANLSHPHIIPVYDFGQSGDTFYMVMENVTGGGLNEWIKSGIVIEEALRIVGQLAQALHFSHERGVVHRDVKPDNVMFREDGSAVLMDFGIARGQDADNEVTKVGQVLGTPTYMSPEQLQGRKIDGRSDIYSLGIMLYQMLAKRVPYEGDDFMALAMMHTSHPIPGLPKQFSRYQKIFEKMVAKEPGKRFQTGMEIAKLFQSILSGKADPMRVDSSAAAELKTAVDSAPKKGKVQGGGLAKPNIAREYMTFLQDFHPGLDVDWETTLSVIFKQLDMEKRKYVYKRLLNPKGVYIDKETKSFAYLGVSSVYEINAMLSSRSLQQLATKIGKIEEALRITRDVVAFADLVESSLSLLDEFDCQDSLSVLKEKSSLRSAFLNDLILIVRGAKFEIPDNKRQLTADAVSTYILQVFIKQQIMGYRFRTEPLSNLEQDDNKFIRKVVAVQAKIRQCDVIRTDEYLFMVGPTRDTSQSQYSIRRFIHEDTALQNIVYFNSVVVPLRDLSSGQVQKKTDWCISRIVTLEKQLSPGIAEIITAMEQAHKRKLLPMLLRPIEADGTHIEAAIARRLTDYEKELTMLILVKFTEAIVKLAKTPDDFEFLFSRVRGIIIDLACDVRDFSAQASTSWSQKAEELDLKMVSYLKLFDKRKDSIFNMNGAEEGDPLLDPSLPAEEFINTVKDYIPQLKELNGKLKQAIEKEDEEIGLVRTWIGKIIGATQEPITPESVQGKIDMTRQRCLVGFIKICKRYPKVTVYLEFEDLVEIDETKRHYALPAGLKGLARLPKLLVFPEDRSALDVSDIYKTLTTDILKVKAKELGG